MVTYAELFTFVIMICAIINLVVVLMNINKTLCLYCYYTPVSCVCQPSLLILRGHFYLK